MGIVIVLLVTVLMSAIGAALGLATAAEMVIAGHFQRAHEARHAAAGALEVALGEFRGLPDWNGVLAGSVRSAHAEGPPTGVRTVAGQPVDLGQLRSLLECQQLAPCTDAAVATVTADRPWGADNPRWKAFRYGTWRAVARAPSAFYVVVLVADDPAEQDGDPGRERQGIGARGRGDAVHARRALPLRRGERGPEGEQRARARDMTTGGPLHAWPPRRWRYRARGRALPGWRRCRRTARRQIRTTGA